MARSGNDGEGVDSGRGPSGRLALGVLACIVLTFLVLRVPVMFRTDTGMDEEYYGVPGIAVARDGIPRIPYLPDRDRDSVFWNVDRVLLAEPPLAFYLQGAMVLLLGESLGAVRAASSLMGVVALFLVYDLSVIWFGSRRAGVLAALALSFSRGFYFPATTARPDMTAIACCLAAVWVMARGADRADVSLRRAAATGAFLGLGFLAHPIAVAGFAQQSLWILWKGRKGFAWFKPWAVMCVVSGLIGSLFLPLLWAYPEEAFLQFGNNILRPGSGHLGSTVLHPFATAAFQVANFVKQMTLWQSLFLAGAGLAGWLLRSKGSSSHFAYCLWSTPLFVGVALGRHTSWGYYVYVVAVLSAGLGYAADVAIQRLEGAGRPGYVAGWPRKIIAASVVVGGLLFALLPGAGVRTAYAHLCNWNNPNYRVDRFVERVLKDIPADAPLMVHKEMIVHVWLRRPNAVLETVAPFSFDLRDHDAPFEYALFWPFDRNATPEKMGGFAPQRIYGDLDDIFSLKTELYRRRPVDD